MTGFMRPNGQKKRYRIHDRQMWMPLTDQRTDTLGSVPKIQEICVTAYEGKRLLPGRLSSSRARLLDHAQERTRAAHPQSASRCCIC
jgi:hypothetical protein